MKYIVESIDGKSSWGKGGADKVDRDLQKALNKGSERGWTLHSFHSLRESNKVHATVIWQEEDRQE